VVGEALATARRGGGPCLIEALTYRLSDHTTSDDASRYRPAAELRAAWATEPLLRMRRYLLELRLWTEADEQELQRQCAAEVEAAVSAYLATPAQSTDAMFDHLFAELPAHLRAQRATARKYATKSSGHH